MYADDILFTLGNSRKGIEELIRELTEFQQVAGLKVNIKKSDLLCFNIRPQEQIEISKIIGISLVTKAFRYLGVQILKSQENVVKLNYGKLWKEVKKDIVRWEKIN